MNSLLELISSIPATQEKINRPMVTLDSIIGLLRKGDRVPGIRAATAPVAAPIEGARNSLERAAAPVNNTLSGVYDNTLGMAPIRRGLESMGMVDRNNFDTSLVGLMRYIMEAQKEPNKPIMQMDTSGVNPQGWAPRQTPPSMEMMRLIMGRE
jgi:hypothetical protein